MKNLILKSLFLLLLLTTLTSCEAIGTIFKAGMGFAVFIIIVIALVIWWIASKVRK